MILPNTAPVPAIVRTARIAALAGVAANVLLALAYFDLAGQAGDAATALQVYGPVVFAIMVYVDFGLVFVMVRLPMWLVTGLTAVNAGLIAWAVWMAATVVF